MRSRLFCQRPVDLGEELLRPEAHEFHTGRGTCSSAGPTALAQNLVDLTNVAIFKIVNGTKGADIQATLTSHTGFLVYLGHQGVTENLLLRQNGNGASRSPQTLGDGLINGFGRVGQAANKNPVGGKVNGPLQRNRLHSAVP